MKKIYSIVGLSLAALVGISASLTPAQDKREVVQFIENSNIGEEAIANIRKNYEAGSYEELLSRLETDYQALLKEDQFDDFIKMREPLSEDEHFNALAKEWEAQYADLVASRNEKLLTVCNGQGDEIICKQVASLLTDLQEDQRQSLDTLTALRFKTPDMAANADERKLIEIDLASEFKMIHLDAEHAAKPIENRIEKQLALRMDMMKQMVEASKSFNDQALKQTVELASQGLDAMQAKIWDQSKLVTMAKKPSTDLEKAVAAILLEHKDRSSDLYQKEFLIKI